MLWTLIFDFYVTYIFGGIDSNGYPHDAFLSQNLDFDPLSTSNVNINFPFLDMSGGYDYFPICLGNYFSLIGTIITLILILVVCFTIIKKCFNIFNRVF